VTAAALVQAVQSAGILLAACLAGVAAIQGKAYQNSSGIAITAIGVGAALVLGYVALGLARTRRWSRTPALLTQLFTGIVGIYLVQGQRYDWGVPALVLCVAGFILLLVPPSIRALTDQSPPDQSSPVSPSRS
jgi:peptidoglycan/LPS O-acetylase OafA/YrhL